MAQYAISLPANIPVALADKNLRNQVSGAYSGLVKMTNTDAATPADALGHIFFRQIRRQKVQAKILMNIFAPAIGSYVFEVPQRPHYDADGKKLTPKESLTFQAMELANEIAEVRNCSPRDCYTEASKLV